MSLLKEMRPINYVWAILLLLLLFCLKGSLETNAEEIKFTVEPIASNNQLDRSLPYFDLKYDYGEKGTEQVKLTNRTNEELIIDISFHTATTNSNGVVEYRQNKLKNTENLPIRITECVVFPKQITLAPRDTQVVTFQVDMPKKRFNGVVAGGIQFREHSSQTRKQKQESTTITSTFSYLLAVVLHGSNHKEEPKIELKKSYSHFDNEEPTVILEFHNLSAQYLNNMSIIADIFHEDRSKPIATVKKEGMQFAPNSIIDFKTTLEQNLSPGKYSITGTLSGEVKKTERHVYTFEDTFQTTRSNERMNDRNRVTSQRNVGIYLLFIGSVLIPFAIACYKKIVIEKR